MQHLIRLLACALVAFAVTWSTASQAERRVALVIGNGTYKNVANLPNPPKDAEAIAALLRNLGFEVVKGTNLTHAGMTDTLRKFANESEKADVALFFYAGHGLQLDGKNYLLPIDSNPKSELDVKLGGPIEVDVMLEQAMGSAKVKLVFLDACRDNPFVEQITRSVKTRSLTIKSGMAEMRSSEGTLLAFATSPGQVALDGKGEHSPFTTALLHNLSEPNQEISVSLTKVRAEVADLTKKKQSPWASTNLTGLFYMNQTASLSTNTKTDASPQVATAAPATAAPTGNSVELEFWRSVKDSNKPEELNAYLTRYPNGAFSSLARARLAELEDAKTNKKVASRSSGNSTDVDPAVRTEMANTETEDHLDLSKNAKRDVQHRLKALGFATPVNGRFSEETRRAITNWQAARDYPKSGYLNKLQLTALKGEELPKTADTDEDDEKATRKQAKRTISGGGGNNNSNSNSSNNNNNNGPGAAAIGNFFGGVVGGVLRRH